MSMLWYNINMLEKSCGVILYTYVLGKRYYLLIQSKDDIFSFPKGHIEENETEKECAIRECFEETSIHPVLQPFFKKIIYYNLPNGNHKEVIFFLGKYENEEPKHNVGFENYDYNLVPYDKAYQLLTFDNLKNILVEAENFLNMYE